MHLKLLKTYPERIAKVDRRMVNSLDYGDINFLSLKRIMIELSRRIASALMCLVTKMVWFMQSMYRIKILKIVWIYC